MFHVPTERNSLPTKDHRTTYLITT